MRNRTIETAKDPFGTCRKHCFGFLLRAVPADTSYNEKEALHPRHRRTTAARKEERHPSRMRFPARSFLSVRCKKQESGEFENMPAVMYERDGEKKRSSEKNDPGRALNPF